MPREASVHSSVLVFHANARRSERSLTTAAERFRFSKNVEEALQEIGLVLILESTGLVCFLGYNLLMVTISTRLKLQVWYAYPCLWDYENCLTMNLGMGDQRHDRYNIVLYLSHLLLVEYIHTLLSWRNVNWTGTAKKIEFSNCFDYGHNRRWHFISAAKWLQLRITWTGTICHPDKLIISLCRMLYRSIRLNLRRGKWSHCPCIRSAQYVTISIVY